MDVLGSDGEARAAAATVADAARALVRLWSRSPETVSPRLSPSQLRALQAVDKLPGINLTRLAVEMGAALPAASRLCDRLAAAGLLERIRAPANRREVMLAVTGAGLRLLDEVAERRRADLLEVLETMPVESRVELVRGLRAFDAAASAVHPPGRT
ncbi:MarR family winged helix-turn-helix transcriptional regulator [Embleya sp. NPDC008237]|uniref:MarR family winged helix-turn-helix transcriptional regulator n=1 Tax=Embleya sp. NPDC008237 TaxID=3363978 RepID=UPI0036E247EB